MPVLSFSDEENGFERMKNHRPKNEKKVPDNREPGENPGRSGHCNQGEFPQKAIVETPLLRGSGMITDSKENRIRRKRIRAAPKMRRRGNFKICKSGILLNSKRKCFR